MKGLIVYSSSAECALSSKDCLACFFSSSSFLRGVKWKERPVARSEERNEAKRTRGFDMT